ncbi:MAG: hypothetical protein RR136_01890, partial [Clostridia bacterium]
SLIVLVVTIIVIIILAGAVILSLTNNNPIEEANKARYSSDKTNVQTAISFFIGKLLVLNDGAKITITPGTLGDSGTATYTIGASGTPAKFSFGPGEAKDGKVGIPLPSYANGITTNWSIDANGNVSLSINNEKI